MKVLRALCPAVLFPVTATLVGATFTVTGDSDAVAELGITA